MLNKITNIVLGIATILSVFAIIVVVFSARAKQMREYEQAHNCRYDYNDLCYTEQEKPWLFKD